MAVGDRTAKKLSQSALTTSLAAQVTGGASKRTEVLKIYITNGNTTTTRYVTLTVYGTAAGNTLIQRIELPAYGSVPLIDCGIILLAGEVLYAKQDTGTDCVITTFGIEEEL